MNIRLVPDAAMAANLLLGACALLVFSRLGASDRLRKPLLVILCAVTFVQVTTQLHYGTWVEEKIPLPTFGQMLEDKKANLTTPSFNGAEMLSETMRTQLERSFREPFLAKFYPDYAVADDNEGVYSLMEKDRSPDRVYLLGGASFEGVPDRRGAPWEAHVKLTRSSFNRMVFEVTGSRPGFLGFAYPYSENWKAVLNGRDVPVHRANGAAHAVLVPAGTNSVEFRYWSPYAFLGMAVTCAVLMLVGLTAGLALPGRKAGAAVAAVFVLTGAGLFSSWYFSLYSGSDMGFGYAWDSPPRRRPPTSHTASARRCSRSTLNRRGISSRAGWPWTGSMNRAAGP